MNLKLKKMKHLNKIFSGIIILIISSSMLISCESNDVKFDTDSNEQNVQTAVEQTAIDNVSEEINDIGESIYLIYGNRTASKDSDIKNKLQGVQMPDCLSITKEITFNKINIILDYGEGCSAYNDHYLSGKMMIAIGFNLNERSVEIDYTFDNFYFNGKKVEGEMHKSRIKMNDKGNPVATINKDIKITWENGDVVMIQGERQREWIEGFGDKIWKNNVFSVTGTWTIIDGDRIEKTVKIETPLIREATCRFIVSGVVEINRNGTDIIVDYGDGDCDNIAIATSNGKEFEIELGKRK